MKNKATYQEILSENKRLKQENKQLKETFKTVDSFDNYVFTELVDIRRLQALMDSFFKLIGLAVAILDNKNNVLVATVWQE